LEDAVQLTQQIMLLVRRWMSWQLACGQCAKRKGTTLLQHVETERKEYGQAQG